MQLAMFDRKGAAEPLNVPLGFYSRPRLSPDGSQVAVVLDDGKEGRAISGSTASRGTSAARPARRSADATGRRSGRPTASVWRFSPTAKVTRRSGGNARTDRQHAERLTKPEKGDRAHPAIVVTGRRAHCSSRWQTTGEYTLQTMALADRKTREIRDVRSAIPTEASFSPDGRWIAYQSASSVINGVTQSFVQPFPPTGAKYLVPQPGGHPYWSTKGDRPDLEHRSRARAWRWGSPRRPRSRSARRWRSHGSAERSRIPPTVVASADSLPDGRIRRRRPERTGRPLPVRLPIRSSWC